MDLHQINQIHTMKEQCLYTGVTGYNNQLKWEQNDNYNINKR